jgi:hypothetical protein
MADKALSAALPARNAPSLANPNIELNRDSCLLKAFALWQSLHIEREALPAQGSADNETALWNVIDRVETEVHDLPATTPAGVACKLWIAIPHNNASHEEEAAAFRADLDWFVTRGDATDWNLRCIVNALACLKSMEASA